MESFKIGETDIILEDYGDGKGKIIIANTWGYNYSYYWGSMGSSLKEFLCSINMYYFTNKLSDPSDNGVFSAEKSVSNFRKYLKTEFKYDLPWYKWPEAQKSLREELKNIEECESEESFVYNMNKLYLNIDYSSLDRYDEEEFIDIIKSACNEPWCFIEKKDSNKTIFLKRLFPKLQKELKKQLKLENKMVKV